MVLGIGGDTIVGVSRRFESELETRINIINSGGDPSTFIVGLAVGLNANIPHTTHAKSGNCLSVCSVDK